MDKKILCLDFDGVLHLYTTPWSEAYIISDPPVGGAQEFCKEAQKKFVVVIHSSRCHQEGGINAIRNWLVKYKFPDDIEIVKDKPASKISIDDRAITFTGVWPDIGDLDKFVPWNKKDLLQTPEPLPIPNTSKKVWDMVIEDMQKRDEVGTQKYNTPLQTFNGRRPLIDAYQEALDLVVYLRQEVEERKSGNTKSK